MRSPNYIYTHLKFCFIVDSFMVYHTIDQFVKFSNASHIKYFRVSCLMLNIFGWVLFAR
jgi:hypothetical protein